MRDNDLPEMVKIEKRVTLPTVTGDGTTSLAPGRGVKLLNRNGKKLIVETTDGLAKGEVEIDETDLFKVIGLQKMKEALAAAGGNQSTSAPSPVAVKPVPQPKAMPKPEPVAAVAPEPKPEPMMPKPEPKPAMVEPTPEPAEVASSSLSPEQIVEAMKKSIGGGAVKEFKLEQVEGWKAGEEEDFCGETFQTGLAAYKAETIFGVKTVQAKALIKDGKVRKWVYAKTGMEIR